MNDKHTLNITAIKLDAEGRLPTQFPLFVTGDWKNSVKGDFKVTLDHLKQMKENFDNGIGFPTEDASTGLAIDFAHNYADQAAAWIKGLELQIDPSDDTKATLFATPVEWTEAGAQAVKSGEFKCVSPMGSFGQKNGKLSMWSNPTNLKEKVANVLEGAGLTNIPFLRGMAPIRADKRNQNDLQNGYASVLYIYDEQKKESDMNLDALRVKEREALSVPELDFLAENQAELSADEVSKFKLAAIKADESDKDQLSTEDQSLLASIKDGSKKVVDNSAEVVEKTRLDALEATATQYREEKVATILDKHVERGAIKQDQTEKWSKQLLAATGDDRKELEDMLSALPSNELLAKKRKELGTGEDVAAGSTAREQMHGLATAKIQAAAKAGKELLYTDALKEVSRENADLLKQDLAEMGVK